ncbi:MAG TPA: 50S ribosomal protein L29 [Phycisphaerales bacterium]|nr:50S ribosomal protein L29 [Phycisphaerales bacterium]
MNGKEVRAMKDDELKLELTKLRASIYDARAKRETESVQDTTKPSKIRKDIARLLTEQQARHLKTNPKHARAAAPAAKAEATPAKKTTRKPAVKKAAASK